MSKMKAGEAYDALVMQGYTEEEIASILRDYQGREGALAQQLEMADSMRQGQPMGQMIGDRYVAPNPMENIGAAMSTFASQKMQRDAMREQKALNEQREAAMAAALRNMNSGPNRTQAPADSGVRGTEQGGLPIWKT